MLLEYPFSFAEIVEMKEYDEYPEGLGGGVLGFHTAQRFVARNASLRKMAHG
jgi:hypothetical protein